MFCSGEGRAGLLCVRCRAFLGRFPECWMQSFVSLSCYGTFALDVQGLHADRRRNMKPLHLAVLLLVLQNIKGVYLSTSMESHVTQNESSITSTFSSSQLGFRRLKRQSNCEPEQYMSDDSTQCCSKCPPGTRLRESCTKTSNSSCVDCGNEEYTDVNNSLHYCLRCSRCQEGNGQEVEAKCNKTHNTKCHCMKNFFCKTPGKCNMCLPCKECNAEIEETVHSCTETNNTVCKAKEKDQRLVALVVLIPIAMFVAGILYCKKESLPCNRKPKSNGIKEWVPFIDSSQPKPEEPVVPDIKLSEETLQLIVEEIVPKTYHQLGIHLGLTEPKLQELEANYHDDVNRQGYYILYYWLQGYGKKGAFPKLIDVLRKAGFVCAAENIIKKLNYAEENTTEII
ncbi:tumor necrosis factor receptor superfamily member 6-like [Pristis pectinata]|uniref:tumor necrosis factor receptor superfamily member 6-like n=1 Tax=Pristis pectinata TaxID=685728 RepID=UPI00223CF6CF|nr:tumor necrosis factor receptor superfamily member 6-like [Pristis pectinata]